MVKRRKKQRQPKHGSKLSRPRLPYIIIDQGRLRDEVLVPQLLKSAMNLKMQIVIPDVAMFEMMKGDKWEYTLRRSLKFLSQSPDFVSVSYGMGELLREEKESGVPAQDIVNSTLTPQFRQLLKEVQIGSGSTLNEMKTRIGDAQNTGRSQHLQHENNKEMVQKMLNAWQSDLSETELQKLRSARTSHEEFIELMSSPKVIKTCMEALENGSYPLDHAKNLIIKPSISGYLILSLAAFALKWLILHGFPTIKPEKVSNDLIDIDYIILGIIGTELHSKDKKVQKLFKDLCEIADRLWERFQK